MAGNTIFSDFLQGLGVPHTGDYSDRQFHSMPFKSLFGFSRLLKAYGIDNEGVQVTDKSVLRQMPVPFIARHRHGYVIVDSVGPDSVDYTYYHRRKSMPYDDFVDGWTGVALMAYPSAESREPDFGRHRFFEIAAKCKLWILIICALALLAYGIAESGVYRHASLIALLAVDLAGIGVTRLLILKSLKVSSHSADRLCAVLQEHGCDTVLEQKASKFFGLFGWSEVGITYFSISTLILLIFPQTLPHLALINGCCLPFTVWSIWYQRFRLHTWCTLCVITQCLLWLQFFCYLFGGRWHGAWSFDLPLVMMGCAYAAGLMAVNRMMTFIENNKKQ